MLQDFVTTISLLSSHMTTEKILDGLEVHDLDDIHYYILTSIHLTTFQKWQSELLVYLAARNKNHKVNCIIDLSQANIGYSFALLSGITNNRLKFLDELVFIHTSLPFLRVAILFHPTCFNTIITDLPVTTNNLTSLREFQIFHSKSQSIDWLRQE